MKVSFVIFYFSLNVICVIKSRKRKCHIQWKGEMHTEFWWGNLKERDRLKYLGVDGKIILKWIIKK